MVVERSTFTGFRPEAIDFLAELAQNNDRAWFQPRKADYERLLKEPMEALVAALAERFEARGLPLQADPKRSVFAHLPRHPVRQGQVAVQDQCRCAGSRGSSRGSDHDARTTRAWQRRLLQRRCPARATSAAACGMPEKPRLDAFRRGHPRRARPRPRRARGPGLPGRVRAGPQPRRPQARAARAPAGPPDGRPVPVQGRRLRPPLSDDEVHSPDLPDILADATRRRCRCSGSCRRRSGTRRPR